MATMYDLILEGGVLVTHKGERRGDIAIRGGKIAAIGKVDGRAKKTMNVAGLHILPGVMDTQVHFREPGAEHKEDFATGTKAALLGGITGVFEMPNTSPPTTTLAALKDKRTRAKGRMYCNYAFYAGATPDNIDTLGKLEKSKACCGIKVFLGSSTGDLLVPDDTHVEAILRGTSRRVAFHSEDEFRLEARKHLRVEGDVSSHMVWRDARTASLATERVLRIARKTRRKVHILHVSTAQEMDMLAKAPQATVEVTPQHLTLEAPDCYERLGTYAQMNPPVRGRSHRLGLWRALREGVVDVIGSDHAPHTSAEKSGTYPATPAGMPGVQTLLPVMLGHVNAGKLSLPHLVSLTSYRPQQMFGIRGKGRLAVGYDADLTLVDMRHQREINEDWIASRCGWTPFAGHKVTGWPRGVLLHGKIAMWDDEVCGPAIGAEMDFAPVRN
ncbi:MAG: dihydroorotase [Hyphomicrobiales bacterium]|nr:dihydroorotase [Hyphomicrobiales bacterium]